MSQRKRVLVIVSILMLAGLFFVSVMIVKPVLATEYNVGVKVGDWMKYGNFVGVGQGMEPINEIDWQKYEVTTVFGKNVTLHSSGMFKNGSALPETGAAVNVETGWSNISMGIRFPSILIAANLQEGDILPSDFALRINKTESRTYVGAIRSVNILNVTTTISGQYPLKYTLVWDKVSGMLLDEWEQITGPTFLEMSANATDTNIFAPSTGPIYIKPDGSVEGTDKIQRNGDIYTFTDNIYNQSIVVQRSNMIIDGNGQKLERPLSGNWTIGINMTQSNLCNVTIKNLNIKGFSDGIDVGNYAKNIIICGNNISWNGIMGIELQETSNVTIFENNLTRCYSSGIYIGWSTNTTIYRNSITDNYVGIAIFESSQNTIYHNNFVNSWQQHVSIGTPNTENAWDNGYPSGGNYWSDYAELDANGDGLGDVPYEIDANNRDNYPLMAEIRTFGVGTWNGTAYSVDVMSNSTITNLNFNPSPYPPTLSFTVEGLSGTAGFCRVAIPKSLMWCDTRDQWVVIVGGTQLQELNITESYDYTYIYFTFSHSTKTVQIQSTHAVPEIPSMMIIAFILLATLLAALVYRRIKQQQSNPQS